MNLDTNLKIFGDCGCLLLWFGFCHFPSPLAILSKISRHTLTFEGAQYRYTAFVTKLGYAIDTRVFRWLDQCCSHPHRRTVNDCLLHFATSFDQVLTDSFHQTLPTAFKDLSPPPPSNPSQPNNAPHRSKRQRLYPHYNKGKECLVNPKQIDAWIISPTDYRLKVMGKNLDSHPRIKQRPMCQRNHSKGYCFSDRVNRVTHIPSQDIEPTLQKLYL